MSPCSLPTSGLLAALALLLPLAVAAQPAALDAQASDPRQLGWMQGFPPAEDKLIRQPDSDFFSFPKLRWTVCHFRQLMPTVGVARGPMPRPLPRAIDPAIDQLSFQRADNGETMRWDESLRANYTDGLIVLHRGRIVYEYYSGCLDEQGQHGVMSVTKSITGLIAQVLVAEGKLDPDARVESLIPELAGSGFGSATIRQVMDMTTDIAFDERYANPEADIWAYGRATNSLARALGERGPSHFYAYLPTIAGGGQHGQSFGYRTPNTDVLGWLVARASGQSVAQWLQARIWQRLGVEQDAYFTVDSIGTPFVGGGFNAGLRDLARLGQLVLDGGRLEDQQLFPAAVVAAIREGGDREAFARGYTGLPGASYRSMWWVFHDDHGSFAARGVHGQTLYIDPTAHMVIVRVASHPVAGNAANDPTSLPAYKALARHLLAAESGG